MSVLLAESHNGVLRLTLNRPEKRNALSRELLEAFDVEFNRAAEDRSIRVVVIGARGSVFSAGHDLSEMQGRSEADYHGLFSLCSKVISSLRRLPQPVIARVHGTATAAGCQLVAACDLAVAATNATFATPGVKIGLFCTTPAVPLVRAIPAKAALEMLLTGTPITAQRAYELGLVNRVVVPEALDAAVDEYVQAILASSPAIIRLGKKAFYDHITLDESAAYDRATKVMTENALLHDAQEGIGAFVQKRTPHWSQD